MKTDQSIQLYRAWLKDRERSPGTIEKYTRDLARFFRETGGAALPQPAAPADGPAPLPAPSKETVAAWRDSLAARGYSPASVNAMLAAVNGYQDFCGNPAGKAKPLKRQRRVFSDAGRELSRAEYFRLLAAARQAGRKRTLLILQTLCSTGIRVSELPFITVEAVKKGRAAIRCKGKCREILLPAQLCKRLERWCSRLRIHAGPVFLTRTGKPLDRVAVWKAMKALCKGRRGKRKGVPPQPAAPVCQDLLRDRKKPLEAG